MNKETKISPFLKEQYGVHGVLVQHGRYYIHDVNKHINELSHKKVSIFNMFISRIQRLGISFI